MEIRDNNEMCVIAPLCDKIDCRKSKRILEKIKNETRSIGLDLSYIQDCSIDFIEGLKEYSNKEIGIFNIPSDIFVLFNIMNIDKVFKLYVSELDFQTKSHQIINRKFALI